MFRKVDLRKFGLLTVMPCLSARGYECEVALGACAAGRFRALPCDTGTTNASGRPDIGQFSQFRVPANASKRKATGHGRMLTEEWRLEAQIASLVGRADEVDTEEDPVRIRGTATFRRRSRGDAPA